MKKKSRKPASLDGIELEILKNSLDTIADEMAIILIRSAYSPIVRDVLDFATAICDSEGHPLAMGLTQPCHLGSFNDAVVHLGKQFAGRISRGDVFIGNDPYSFPGQHLPDLFVIKPIFSGRTLFGWAATLAHHVDVGGIVPGSNSIGSTEIFQEGLRLPFLKLVDAGKPNDDLFAIIALNVRMPDLLLGDIRAQMAACTIGERGLALIAERYTIPGADRAFTQLHRYAERLAREEIRKIPEGVYAFTDHIDGLGEDPKPIELRATITIKSGQIAIDWTGTSPQVAGGINTHLPFTQSCCYAAVRSVISADIPNCYGFTRTVSVTAPTGTLVNARFPAPCGARGITGWRIMDCVMGALAGALPEQVPADNFGGNSLIGIAFDHEGRRDVFVETVLGNSGGASWHDGQDAVPHLGANLANVPVEMIETSYPMLLRRYGFVPDSGGPGRYRGGLSIERVYQIQAEHALLTLRTDKVKFPPHGLAGGMPGSPSRSVVTTEAGERVLPVLPTKAIPLQKGSTFHHVIPGGGGYGNPMDREMALVLQDALDGKVSLEQAHSAYGVVIRRSGASGADLALDEAASLELRHKRQLARART
jgi:N-methylhydantoinase B